MPPNDLIVFSLKHLKNAVWLFSFQQQNDQTVDVAENQSLIDSRLENLQDEIRKLRLEKSRLEDILTSTRTQLHKTRTELTAMRHTFGEKSRELEKYVFEHSTFTLVLVS